MADDAKGGFQGLVTAVGELAAQPGALRVADNVTLRKQGALECRPSFASTSITATQWKTAVWYRGTRFLVGPNNVLAGGAGAGISVNFSGQSPAPTPVRADVVGVKEARGNLYMTSSLGLLKLTSPTQPALILAGAPPTDAPLYLSGLTATGTDLLLQNNQQVAYRAVVVKTDVNGVVTRSRPTGAQIAANTSGSARSPQVLVYPVAWHSSEAATLSSAKIEIYRTRVFPTTAQVDDEMQLVYTQTLTDLTAFVTWVDRVPDARRGMTLYTSPSRGGMENAADPPPGAACIERFRGSLFFGNIVGPHRIVFSYAHSGIRTGQATGVGERTFTADSVAGSNQLTNVSAPAGIRAGTRVGAGLGGTGTPNNLNWTVVSVSGTTLTMSAAAVGTNTGQTYYANDTVMIDGTTAPIMLAKLPANTANNGYMPSNTWSVSVTGGGVSRDYTAYEITPPESGYEQTVVLERKQRGGAAFELRASHGEDMSPAIPLVDAATGLASTNDVIPHGLAWSEPDEPEHCPPKNFARVGDSGKAIVGLVALRDCLLIIKEDGVYRLSGTSTANFRIDTLDTTALCVCPGSIRRLANECYFLSNLGLVRVDDTSVTLVSRAIQTELAPIIASIRNAARASGLYYMPGLTGIVAASDDASGEYWLLLGSSNPSFGGQALVYNASADGFTTYTFAGSAPVALATDNEGQPNLLMANAILAPTTARGPVLARVAPHAFAAPAITGRFLTHMVAGFAALTGTSYVRAKFTSSESMSAATSITEDIEAPQTAGAITLPHGSLLRHPIPRAMARAYLLWVELLINVTDGTFQLELLNAESRENISNKRPTHGSGAA